MIVSSIQRFKWMKRCYASHSILASCNDVTCAARRKQMNRWYCCFRQVGEINTPLTNSIDKTDNEHKTIRALYHSTPERVIRPRRLQTTKQKAQWRKLKHNSGRNNRETRFVGFVLKRGRWIFTFFFTLEIWKFDIQMPNQKSQNVSCLSNAMPFYPIMQLNWFFLEFQNFVCNRYFFFRMTA